MKAAHVNEAGIVLRFGVSENLPSQSWAMMLDQLRSEHMRESQLGETDV